MIKYRVKLYCFTPVEYEVTRETEYSIWYINLSGKEVMERKTHTNGKWYDTFEEAKKDQTRKLLHQAASAEHKAISKKKDAEVLEAMNRALTQKEMSEKVWGGGRY